MKVAILLCTLFLVHSAFAADQLFRDVAVSFTFNGYDRVDPFELSPDQIKHQQLMQQNNELAIALHDTLPANAESAPSTAASSDASLLQEQEVVPQAQVDAELKIALAKPASPPSLVETQSSRRFIDTLAKGAAKLRKAGNAMTGKFKPSNAQLYEDCMACRLIWKQVEMDVSNARYVEDVQASFEHNCMDAQKSTIFYKACEDMYDDMYALTDDYMSGQYTVDQICQRSKMCSEPTQNKQGL